MSEMYAMLLSPDLYFGLPEAKYTTSIAQSMQNHIAAVASGIQT